MITFISGWATTSKNYSSFLTELEVQSVEWSQLLDSDELLRETSICIGWSIGGIMALKATQKYQFEKCVLISTTPRQLEDDNFPGVPLEVAQGLEQGIQYAREDTLKQFCTMNLHPSREHFKDLYKEALSIDPELLLKGLQFLQHADLRKELSHITLPTLILHGTEDAITPFSSAQYLQSHLPNATLIPIDGAGHALPITHAKEVASHIQEFLGGAHS